MQMIVGHVQYSAVRTGKTPRAIGHILAMLYAFQGLEDEAGFDYAVRT